MQDVVFDLDDLAENSERNCIPLLLQLKDQFPKLKVTLFAIPMYEDKDQSVFFHEIKRKYGDWIQLGIHGWTHDSNFECQNWNYVVAAKRIWEAYNMGCFEKLFKAPGWQISRDTYQVLKNAGFICADHKFSAYTEPGIPNKDRRPEHLKVYEIDHPWMIHGHTWDCVGNGLPELVQRWKKKGFPWTKETNFHFITEIVK